MPLSPTASSVRDTIKLELESASALDSAVTGVKVEPTPVDLVTDPDWKSRLVDGSNRLHFYWIDLPSIEEIEAEQRGRFVASYRFRVHGYMAVQDTGVPPNSYRAFSDEIEKVRNHLRKNDAIFGTPERVQVSERTAPLETFEAVMMGDVLCWHAVLALNVEATENKTF